MRDTDQIISLLREMAEPNEKDGNYAGWLTFPMLIGSDETEQQRLHHAELLVDEGLASWTSNRREILRITSQGYDFLNVIKLHPENPDILAKYVKRGFSYGTAINKMRNLDGDEI